jgi:hypothetical protein
MNYDNSGKNLIRPDYAYDRTYLTLPYTRRIAWDFGHFVNASKLFGRKGNSLKLIAQSTLTLK